MWGKNYRRNLFFLGLLIFLMVISIFFLWMQANNDVRSIVEEQYQEQQFLLVQYISDSVGMLLNERVLQLEVIAQKQIPDDLFMSDLKVVYEAADIYYVLEFIDINGTVVSGYPSENVPLGYNLYTDNASKVFDILKRTGKVHITDPVTTMEGTFGFYVWVPVMDNGNFRGVILGIVTDETIIRMFESSFDSSHIYIMSNKGLVLYDRAGIYKKGTKILETANIDPQLKTILEAQMRGDANNDKYWQVTSDGNAYILVSYSPIDWYNQHWSVGLRSPAEATDRIIVPVYKRLLSVTVISMLFIIFVSSLAYLLLLKWNKTLEQEVGKKTQELKLSNESLSAANEKLMELDMLKNEFLSMVSHELKTPLTAVRTSSEFLLEDNCDPGIRKQLLALIVRNVDRQVRLVDNILDISRIESNRIKFNIEQLSLHEVLGHSVECVRHLSEDKGVIMDMVLPDPALCVMADRDKLIQVFINILNNAIKFTPAGGTISTNASIKGDVIELSFQDTGIGIDPSSLEHIFEKFYQIDSTSTRKAGGCGLGLAITKGLLDGMACSIRVESTLGVGSRFILSLPMAAISKNGRHSN